MNGASRIRFWERWVEVLVVRVAIFVTAWLKRHNPTRYREIVGQSGSSGGIQGLAQAVQALPEPFKRKRPESLAGSGSPGDTESHHPLAKIDAPRQSFNAVHERIHAQHHDGVPVALPEWAKEIRPFLANQLSVHTRRAYETDLKQFFSFLEGRIPVENLGLLRAEHVILYRKYLEEGRMTGKPLEKTTINRKLAVVKSFLQWLRINHVIRENPAQHVKGYPQSQESSLKGLSDAEAKRILELPDTNRRSGALHAAILHVLLFLGLRKGELIDLKLGDLGEERGISVLRVRGKGHRVRVLPLTASVKSAIEHYLHACRRDRADQEAPLFTPTKNPRTKSVAKPLNPNAITYIVVRYARKAGVLKNISPHSCRATCISNALDRRATHRSVQHLAGWSTPLMIQRYDKRREDLKNSAAFLVDYTVDEPGPGAPPPKPPEAA